MGKQLEYRFRLKAGGEERLIRAKTFEEAVEAVWVLYNDPKDLARLGSEFSLVDLQTREERKYPATRKG